jgi:hypothetical protein
MIESVVFFWLGTAILPAAIWNRGGQFWPLVGILTAFDILLGALAVGVLIALPHIR